MTGFEKLTEDQRQKIKDAMSWITVLIAGADGKIEAGETAWAEKVTKIRGYHNPSNELTPFYEAVGEEFSEKLDHLIANVPEDVSERNAILSRKLEQLNDILPLLDHNNIGFKLLASYRSFAEHIAKSSGGFLGFFSVSKDEGNLIGLPMINDIPFLDPTEA